MKLNSRVGRFALVSIMVANFFTVTSSLAPANAVGAGTLDQQQVLIGPTYDNESVGSYVRVVQSFTPSTSGLLNSISLLLSKNVPPYQSDLALIIEIHPINSDNTADTNTVLARTEISSTQIVDSFHDVKVDFLTPASLVAETLYAFSIHSEGALSAKDYFIGFPKVTDTIYNRGRECSQSYVGSPYDCSGPFGGTNWSVGFSTYMIETSSKLKPCTAINQNISVTSSDNFPLWTFDPAHLSEGNKTITVDLSGANAETLTAFDNLRAESRTVIWKDLNNYVIAVLNSRSSISGSVGTLSINIANYNLVGEPGLDPGYENPGGNSWTVNLALDQCYPAPIAFPNKRTTTVSSPVKFTSVAGLSKSSNLQITTGPNIIGLDPTNPTTIQTNINSLDENVVVKDAAGNILCSTTTGFESSRYYSGAFYWSRAKAICDWTPSTVGTFVATAYYSGNETLKASSFSLGSIEVTRSPSTVDISAFDISTSMYGNMDTLTATASVPGLVTFKNGSTLITGCESVATTGASSPYSVQCLWIPRSAATNTLSASLAPSDAASYLASVSSDLSFYTSQRNIQVTASAGKTKIVGAADPEFTYSITSGALLADDSLLGVLHRTNGENVGTYSIGQFGGINLLRNDAYNINVVSADFIITRAVPALTLSYPNSNIAILSPGGTDTPTASNSGDGAVTFTTSTSSAICTVNSTSGVITLVGAGNCDIEMNSADGTNYSASSISRTVVITLQSTSLAGINPANLVSMGSPIYASASLDQSHSFSSGGNGASVTIPAGALATTTPISIYLLTDATAQLATITDATASALSVVVAWVAIDGSVPSTNFGKAISVTLTNSAIKSGAKVYSVIGGSSTYLGTATSDGQITTQITSDPVLLVVNPVVAPPSITAAPIVDKSVAEIAANLKAEEEAMKAAKLMAAQEQAAKDLQVARDKAEGEIKAAQKASDLDAKLKAEADARIAAELKAKEDSDIAVKLASQMIVPDVTLYSISSSLKLSVYDATYLKSYIATLKPKATLTCIGYIYPKLTTLAKAKLKATSQATAVCKWIKAQRKTLTTKVVVYPASKAPKAAAGAKWVAVSYRVDGFKS